MRPELAILIRRLSATTEIAVEGILNEQEGRVFCSFAEPAAGMHLLEPGDHAASQCGLAIGH